MTENKISWNITKPLTSAVIYGDGDGDDDQKVPASVFNKIKPIKSGDKVAILWYKSVPVLTEPVKGTTLKNILMAVERGMKKKIENNFENAQIVYPIIGQFFRKDDRIKLIKKFEENKLSPADIAGDHVFY